MSFFDDAAEITACRPGERMLHGQRYVFNMDMLVAHEADQACEKAPLDLSVLSDVELRSLRMRWLNRQARLPGEPLTLAIGRRVSDEFGRRNWDSAGRIVALAHQLNASRKVA